MKESTVQLSLMEKEDLLQLLRDRFSKNQHRHEKVKWEEVEEQLLDQPGKLWSLHQMEQTGGEPDVALLNSDISAFAFFDFAPETPKGRRSLCYDDQALKERKEHKPRGSAQSMAAQMGIQILDEQQYRLLQSLESVDLKTSSWIQTPESIRKLGGALFCDRRYDQVFVYHNGAISYYAARGFRGMLRV